MSQSKDFQQITRTALNIMWVNTPEWNDFVVPIMNKAEFDLSREMRLGQRVMNALHQLHPQFSNAVSGTSADVWELDDAFDQSWEHFWSKVFELFVQDL